MNSNTDQTDVACPICMKNVLNNFVRLECSHLVCLNCWRNWRPISYTCPCCRKRSHKEQERTLSNEDFPELYTKMIAVLSDIQIVNRLERLGKKINDRFVSNYTQDRTEDIEKQIRYLNVEKKRLDTDIQNELYTSENTEKKNTDYIAKLFATAELFDSQLTSLNAELRNLYKSSKTNDDDDDGFENFVLLDFAGA